MKNIGRFLAVFVLLSLPAFADDRDLTVFIGGQFPGSVSLSDVPPNVENTLTNPTDSGLIGIRYGKAKVFGHEETFAYTSKFLDEKSNSIVLSGNLIVQAPLPMFRPYVTAGMGTIISWGSGPSDIGTKFAVNYGGGLKIRPLGPVGFRIDGRGYSVFSVQDQILNIGEVSVGILFAF